jgi:hypothetical protein
MTLQKINTRNTVLFLMIVVAIAMRFVSYQLSAYVTYHTSALSNLAAISNFTPVGAVALFGGTYFTDKWKAYLVPLGALFISDLVLNYLYSSRIIIDYSATIWVYLSFAIMVFIGTRIKKVNVLTVSGASLLSVVIFWLLTDFPWLYGGNLYPHTIQGYMQSLIAAIPFQRNMLFGDAVFGLLLFGGFELAKSKYTTLRSNRKFAV